MKKLSSFFSFIIKKLKHNWGLKILSFGFALILWNSAVAIEDPVRPVTYDDIPITVVGVEQFNEKDLALLESISSYASTVKVTVNINRSEISDYDENSIVVQLDLSRVTGTGTTEIKLVSTSADVQKITPEYITVEVDELTKRVIPVECEVIGTLPDGYYKSSLSISPNAIQVSGAKSIVDEIDTAYLRLDLSDRTESINMSKEYTFIDSEGSAIDSSALDVEVDSIVLEMDITPKKELYVTESLIGSDNLADGYQIAEVIVEPDTVVVTGEAELLDGLTSVQTEAIDITGQSENVFVSGLSLLLPDSITLLDAETVSVLVEIEETMGEASFEAVEIELRNIPDGLNAVDFLETVDINVIAPASLIENIVANHITLYVDMTGAKAGENTLPILYEAPEEYRVSNVVISQETVTVVLE